MYIKNYINECLYYCFIILYIDLFTIYFTKYSFKIFLDNMKSFSQYLLIYSKNLSNFGVK